MIGHVISNETKEKLRQANFGKPFTTERIENIKKSLIGKMDGEQNGFYGKHHSEETKSVFRNNSKNYWDRLKSDPVRYELWKKNVSEKTKLGKLNQRNHK